MVFAYGDESATSEIVVFAAAVFGEHQVGEAEHVLAQAKASVGVPADAQLHCRELFAPDARARTAWAHVEEAALWAMLEALGQALQAVSYRPVVSIVANAEIPPGAVAPASPLGALNEKGIATLAYLGVQAGLVHRFGVEGVRLWLDPDPTKIPWAGRRRRADLTRSAYVDLEPGQEPELFTPAVSRSPKPRLLEVADLYAYTVARAVSQTVSVATERFRSLAAAINPERWSLLLDADPRWTGAGKNNFLAGAGTLWRLRRGDQELRCRFSPRDGYWVGVDRGDAWVVSEVYGRAEEALERARRLKAESLAEGWEEF